MMVKLYKNNKEAKMKRLVILSVIGILLLVFSSCSHNIKLDSQYLTSKERSIVICKYQAKPTIESKSDGIIADMLSSRFDVFLNILKQIDLREKVRNRFVELLKNKKSFEVVTDTNIITQVAHTTNYSFLLTKYNIPLIFEIKIKKFGIFTKSGFMGILTNYYTMLKIEGTLKDLNKNGKIVWRYIVSDTLKMKGSKNDLVENNGKIIKTSFDILYNKLIIELILNLE